jgi:molybdopterin converting factor small subunit
MNIFNKSWFEIVVSLANTTHGQFILSSLRLATNIFSYITITTDLLSKYEGINNMIVFEHAFKYGTNTRTFHEITRYLSTSTVEGAVPFMQWIAKNAPVGSTFTGFVGGITEAIESSNYYPSEFINKNASSFFTIAVDSIYKLSVTFVPNAYFASLKQEAEKNKKKLIKTEDEQIKQIEQQVIKISDYKKARFSNEEIAELLNPTPDKPNNYRFPIIRYMVEFKRKLKK